MTNGWIKIHRRVIDKGWFKKPNAFHLWSYLLIKASFTDTEYIWNGENIKLKPGQFVTGRKQISKETGIHESTVERLLNFFEQKEKQIEQQKSNTSRLISILNYKEYQYIEQQANNKRTTSEQQANTKEEVQEGKEGQEVAATADFLFLQLDERGKKIYEMFRRNLERDKYDDTTVISEVNKFANRYPAIMVNNSGALVNTWCTNLKRPAVKKGEIYI